MLERRFAAMEQWKPRNILVSLTVYPRLSIRTKQRCTNGPQRQTDTRTADLWIGRARCRDSVDREYDDV